MAQSLLSGDSKIILTFVGIWAFMLATEKFDTTSIELDPYSETIYAVHRRWWGVNESCVRLRWFQPEGYDIPGWMAQSRSGEWYLYITEDDYIGIAEP